MHELSIALSIIEGIEEEMQQNGYQTIEAVHLRIGVLAGVDQQALRFAFELASEGTELQGVRLVIESVRLLVSCPVCNATHTPDPQHILCPRCLTPEQEILEGKELEVRALELAL